MATLALLAWAASTAIEITGRRWFERDTEMRGRLAVTVAREALARHWVAGDHAAMARLLVDLTRDERILAALACGLDLKPVAATHTLPPGLECASLGAHVRPDAGGPLSEWHSVQSAGGGRVHVSAFPLVEEDRPLGFVALVHDMSYADRRETLAQRFTLGALVLLALGIAAAAALGGQVAWRRWNAEMRRQIRGGHRRREFQPLLRDIQELSYQEIADHLQLPEGTVKSRINRGRTELARQVQRIREQDEGVPE